jgi:hypothetical protein
VDSSYVLNSTTEYLLLSGSLMRIGPSNMLSIDISPLLTYVPLKDSINSSPSFVSFSRLTDSSIILFNQAAYMNYDRRIYSSQLALATRCTYSSRITNTISWAERIGMLNFSDSIDFDECAVPVCGGYSSSIAKLIVLDTFNGIPVL